MIKKYNSYKKEEYDDNDILPLLHLDDSEIRFNLFQMTYDVFYFYKNDWIYYIARHNNKKHMITFNNKIFIKKINMNYVDIMKTLKNIMIKYSQFDSIVVSSCHISDDSIKRIFIS